MQGPCRGAAAVTSHALHGDDLGAVEGEVQVVPKLAPILALRARPLRCGGAGDVVHGVRCELEQDCGRRGGRGKRVDGWTQGKSGG